MFMLTDCTISKHKFFLMKNLMFPAKEKNGGNNVAKKILITGVSGFLGSTLKKHFEEQGYEVYGTARKNPKSDKDIILDIAKKETFKNLPDFDFDYVINNAGIVNKKISQEAYDRVNAHGALNVFKWAKEHNCKHFIQISSISVYGAKCVGEDISEENPIMTEKGSFGYGISKARGEKYIVESGMKGYTMLRLPSIMGENDHFVSPTIIKYLLEGKMFRCSNKDKKFSLLHAVDLGNIIEQFFDYGPINDAVNCPSHHTTWETFVKEHARLLSLPYKPKRKSLVLSFLIHRKDEGHSFISSSSGIGSHFSDDKIRSILGHLNVQHPWQEGVAIAVKNYKRATEASVKKAALSLVE